MGATSASRPVVSFRVRFFPVWIKALTIWTVISLLGTEWRYEVLAANCPPSQTPIDDTVRVTEYTYDIEGRVTKVCTPEGTIYYEYDPATGRKTRTYTDNNDTRYTYHQLGRLKTVAVHKKNGQTVNPPEVTTYTYTDVGSRESVELPNGTRTTYEYNNLNRLTKVSILDSQSSILSSFAYALHPTGRRTASTEITRQDDGSYTTNAFSWAYDQMYRLTNETLSASVTNDSYTASYVYDLVGNRLAKDSTGGLSSSSTAYQYNANDQLLQEAVTGGSGSSQTAYQYDANGSLTNQITQSSVLSPQSTSYAYDLDNRLSGATIYRLEGTNTVAITASYLYNPSGIRVRSDTQTRINGSPGSPSTKHTFYLVDSMNHTGYAQVLEEHSSLNSGPSTLDRSYTIGDDVLSQSDGTSSPATHYLGYDGHGSTRILTDSIGAIASGGRYNYDAYGVSLGTQPSTVSPPLTSLLYTGEQFDTGLQQYYLRARYYNQSNGRFTQLDPFAGVNSDPQSLHKYAYAHADPVNGIDPSGFEKLESQLTAAGIINILLSQLLRAVAVARARAVAGVVWTALNLDKVLFYLDFGTAVIGAGAIVANGIVQFTGLALETAANMTEKVVNSWANNKRPIPDGWAARGIVLEGLAGAHLGEAYMGGHVNTIVFSRKVVWISLRRSSQIASTQTLLTCRENTFRRFRMMR